MKRSNISLCLLIFIILLFVSIEFKCAVKGGNKILFHGLHVDGRSRSTLFVEQCDIRIRLRNCQTTSGRCFFFDQPHTQKGVNSNTNFVWITEWNQMQCNSLKSFIY